jgi:hypothetical protein
MRLALSDTLAPILVTTTVTLRKGEVYRLAPHCPTVWVVSGRAWATVAGEDIVVDRGETVSFNRRRDPVVITALGKNPLVLEIAAGR